jgi:hypothetical protein
MIRRMTSKITLLLFIAVFAIYANAGSVPEGEYHSYKVGHGIEFQATDEGNFVNILRDGKLLWRQYVGYADARFRRHEERRFTFDDIDRNGVPDFFYIFENEVGSADMMRSDTFLEGPVEKREPEDFPFPNVGINPHNYSFFLCLELGQRCVLVRYQKEGRCYKNNRLDLDLCATYRGIEREKVLVGTSSVVSDGEWDTILAYFGKFMGEETVSDFRYALSKGHTSLIKTPDLFQTLEPWVDQVKIRSPRAVLYRDAYGERALGGYLVAGDEAEVLDRYVGAVMANWDATVIVSHKVDEIAARSDRLLVRYKGKRSTTIGWIQSADTEPAR